MFIKVYESTPMSCPVSVTSPRPELFFHFLDEQKMLPVGILNPISSRAFQDTRCPVRSPLLVPALNSFESTPET